MSLHSKLEPCIKKNIKREKKIVTEVRYKAKVTFVVNRIRSAFVLASRSENLNFAALNV